MENTAAAHPQEPNYMAVFWALLVLTLVEVGIFYMHLNKVVLITALVLMALIKASLVAWYFMHLRSERWSLILMVVLPMLLCLDLFIGLLPDVGRILH
jgi:cytochrome c oxidase subunit 4